MGASSAQRGLHVVGNKLLDAKGRNVHFRGVNRSGTEYACIQGWGIFDGPNGAKSIRAIAAWHVNAVRIPLNEQCWLGINGVKPAYGGASYRQAIVRYVNLLHRHNMYAELSLMWAAPGTTKATYQPAAPDADHSPAFWSSLAATFKNDPNVILAPWGEPVVDANCFLKGGCTVPFNRERELQGGGHAAGRDRDAAGRLQGADRDPGHQLRERPHAVALAQAERPAQPARRRGPRLRQATRARRTRA